MDEQTPAEQQKISDGQTITNFVQDPVVQNAFAALALQYFEDFKKAKTVDELRLAKAQCSLMDDLANQFQVVIDRGSVARRQRESREIREARTPKSVS